MQPVYHVTISAVAGLGLAWWLQEPGAGVACLAGGVLIDLDHYLDYYWNNHVWPKNYQDMARYCARPDSGKLYLAFHAFEFLVVLWCAIFVLNLNGIWLGLAVGLTLHLVCDQFSNPLKPLGYFITYRIMSGFERRRLFTDAYIRQHAH